VQAFNRDPLAGQTVRFVLGCEKSGQRIRSARHRSLGLRISTTIRFVSDVDRDHDRGEYPQPENR
jgi:hypothetical protein